MTLFTWQDMGKVPEEIKSHLMKYMPQVMEASKDLVDMKIGTMTDANFEAKWGVKYAEVKTRIDMVKLVLGGAKATATETKEMWAWVILLLKRRKEKRSQEHKQVEG